MLSRYKRFALPTIREADVIKSQQIVSEGEVLKMLQRKVTDACRRSWGKAVFTKYGEIDVARTALVRSGMSIEKPENAIQFLLATAADECSAFLSGGTITMPMQLLNVDDLQRYASTDGLLRRVTIQREPVDWLTLVDDVGQTGLSAADNESCRLVCAPSPLSRDRQGHHD